MNLAGISKLRHSLLDTLKTNTGTGVTPEAWELVRMAVSREVRARLKEAPLLTARARLLQRLQLTRVDV